MEFVPAAGGWIRKTQPFAPADYAANANLRPPSPEGHSPPNYPPHVERWRLHALRSSSQDLSFGTPSADRGGGSASGAGGPPGWSPTSADGILNTGGKSISLGVSDHYVREGLARKARLAEEKAAAEAALASGKIPLKGGWPVDQTFKRLSPRSHFILGPLSKQPFG